MKWTTQDVTTAGRFIATVEGCKWKVKDVAADALCMAQVEACGENSTPELAKLTAEMVIGWFVLKEVERQPPRKE